MISHFLPIEDDKNKNGSQRWGWEGYKWLLSAILGIGIEIFQQSFSVGSYFGKTNLPVWAHNPAQAQHLQEAPMPVGDRQTHMIV